MSVFYAIDRQSVQTLMPFDCSFNFFFFCILHITRGSYKVRILFRVLLIIEENKVLLKNECL